MWITSGDATVVDLTNRCVESTYEVYCDVQAGVDLVSGDPAVLNIVNVSMSYLPSFEEDISDVPSTQRTAKAYHVEAGVYIADAPTNFILFDGYNAQHEHLPYVFRPEV